MTRILLALPFLGLLFVAGVQVGIDRGRGLESTRWPQEIPMACVGYGESVYLSRPQDILAGIRLAEGVSSYGVMTLAVRYGDHRSVPEEIGRAAAAAIVHETFQQWVAEGRPGDFLGYLRDRWAPLTDPSDTMRLNANWQRNVIAYLVEHERK